MDENLNLEGNTEIEKALKEFETKSQTEQNQKTPEIPKDSEVPKIVQLVMKWSGGAIKEQKQAEYILLGVAILAIGISLFLIFRGSTGQKEPILYQEDLTPTARATIPEDILKTIPYRYGK